ncbi:MAG TPA: hypothetical protein VGM11_13055 [Acidobacteriaceae bacterium]|jgi:hypothetical protein
MNHQKRLITALTAALVAATALPASAAFGKNKKKVEAGLDMRKLTPAQSALIDKSIAREAVVIKTLRQRAPIVETYIQNMRPDPVMGQIPDSDVHFLARVNFGKVINDEGYVQDKQENHGFLRHSLSYLTSLSGSLHLTYHESGFVQMLLVDSNSYNRQMYTFNFLRNDFLGTIPTVVFDVQPTKKSAIGRFAGRIWIDRNSGNIVRFNGSFSGGEKDVREYYHFDSWRTNVQDGLWLPTSVYIEESDPKSPQGTLKFKAINHIWGYSLKVPQSEADQTDLQVVGATDESQQSADISPLQAQRQWVEQAEDNVVDRLYTAGLIDAPSDFDKILEALANNILAYNNIPLDRPIKVRTLLTEPLESLSVGDTILLSKGLIDTTAVPTSDGAQQMGNLNALLAFQVAHIVLGHHIDTKYAFSDRLMFPTESAFQKLPMHHTDADNEAAAKKAVELLSCKDLEGGEQYISLYLQQLQVREKGLKALTDPQIGDGLLRPDGTFWLQALVAKGPKLNNSDLKQQAAMPLSQFLRFDPWTDQVIKMNTAYEPLLSARDKLPFEITPVYLRLAYWAPPAAPPAAPAAAPATGSPAPSQPAPSADANPPAPAAADNASSAPASAPATQPQN